MCGIAGIFRLTNVKGNLESEILRMGNALIHRGPDRGGTWIEQQEFAAFAHRRLSIIDCSPAGDQPMVSASGRYVIVFNGEIYNHLELRSALNRNRNTEIEFKWRGHSDTETLLAAIDAWGIEKALQHIVGMFAIAVWDNQRKSLTLSRDRFGEKPLYYGKQGGLFFFSSELKALRAHSQFVGKVDRDALALYLRFGYIPTPYSIYEGIQKLPPGTWVEITQEKLCIQPTSYWQMPAAAVYGDSPELFKGTETEALGEVERLLNRAVSQQMVADVPLGAFLSGGIDSSLIVTLMQQNSTRPIKTFSIGFYDSAYDEAIDAKRIAQHLGTDHTELYVSSEQAQAIIPLLPQIYDEPFADSSQIPMYLVSQLAREQVAVSLSGDGGDELFGGYNRYRWGSALSACIEIYPHALRQIGAALLRTFSPKNWDQIFSIVAPLVPSNFQQRLPGEKVHKLAKLLECYKPEDLYNSLVSIWSNPQSIICKGGEPPLFHDKSSPWHRATIATQMMRRDLIGYLPDDILVKVDRAAMALSLETRIPFLDFRVAEFAGRLPLHMKIRAGQGKWILRQLLYKSVPRELVERPKMGFGVPIDSWLRGPLRDWAEALLDKQRLSREGYLQAAPIRQKWVEHLSGRKNWQHQLWCVLMFQSWLENERC